MARRQPREHHCRPRERAVLYLISLHKLEPSTRSAALLLECPFRDAAHHLRPASVLVRLDSAIGATIGQYVRSKVMLRTRAQEMTRGLTPVLPTCTHLADAARLDSMFEVRRHSCRGMITASLALTHVEEGMTEDRSDIDRLRRLTVEASGNVHLA
jgi:hypothetical protein